MNFKINTGLAFFCPLKKKEERKRNKSVFKRTFRSQIGDYLKV